MGNWILREGNGIEIIVRVVADSETARRNWQQFLDDPANVPEPLTRQDMVAAAQRVVAMLGWKAGPISKG